MLFRKLQTNIVIILVIILVTGMILIDFVMMSSVKRILIRSEIDKARLFLSAMESHLENVSDADVFGVTDIDLFERLSGEAGVDCAHAKMKGTDIVYAIGRCVSYEKGLDRLIRQSISDAKDLVKFFGDGKGLFVQRHEGVMVASPLYDDGVIVGGTGAALRFDAIYAYLQEIQYILILYIIINTVFLTFFGFYRLSRVTVKPVHKLLEKAEDYWEFDEEMFFYEQDKDGFRKLATTFSRMLKRISADKAELEKTVSHLENVNRELKKAQEEVIRAEKLASVGRLSAGIAHEIGNPIAIVMGYLDLLKSDDIIESDRKEFVQRTEKEIDRIHGIIRQLLNFSRSSDGDAQIVSVHEIVKDVVDVVRHQPMMSGTQFHLDLGANLDKVLADAGKLRQVFLNLIINAGDAILSTGTNDGKIVIGSSVENEAIKGQTQTAFFIRVSFQDNGAGISQESLASIFDPFFTTKEPGKGTGLGLSTSIAIVEQMGGRITVEAAGAKGTTMIVHLPLKR